MLKDIDEQDDLSKGEVKQKLRYEIVKLVRFIFKPDREKMEMLAMAYATFYLICILFDF